MCQVSRKPLGLLVRASSGTAEGWVQDALQIEREEGWEQLPCPEHIPPIHLSPRGNPVDVLCPGAVVAKGKDVLFELSPKSKLKSKPGSVLKN